MQLMSGHRGVPITSTLLNDENGPADLAFGLSDDPI